MKAYRFFLILFFSAAIFGQKIPSDKVLEIVDLQNYLTKDVKNKLSEKGEISTKKVANYFREKFAERYFYNYKTVDKRFEEYQNTYPIQKDNHIEAALDQLKKYPSKPFWKLPFNYQNGESVNAYALRHLARQHKMVDIAFYYFYQHKNIKYIDYFTEQMQSLNTALHQNKYEIIEDGNGVYEAFRAGYRVLNWLQIHNLFLAEKAYSDEEQLVTIATLLQHASYLFDTNQEFVAGNHQTRGLSALAMVSILLKDFVNTDVWYQHSMKLLGEHLRKEINEDGFQFERTVHYHMSDIENYFYVYQLAKNSNLKVTDFWKNKLESLFTTLTKIAFPDKSAPVFSDDTDTPWADKNDISDMLTLGYLLFEKSTLGYFANKKVSSKMYWYVNQNQLDSLKHITAEKPAFKSCSFSKTGYYIMREGWEPNDKVLITSAGLDAEKPDHQHGDMLGLQAFANGNIILPNYQVRYSLKDLELFKNSMTKNVALVDDELQGKNYTSNQGGSGFGKFKQLPNPKTIAFQKEDTLEIFMGSHDGFKNIGVKYSRQIINVENNFWIVKDNFSSEENHTYKQVWQGHFSKENMPNLLRASFSNGSGLDIYQLNKVDTVIADGARGKQWNVIYKNNTKNFHFITILYPFSKFDERIEEENESPSFSNWIINNDNLTSDAIKTLSKKNNHFFFGVTQITIQQKTIHFSEKVDIYISQKGKNLQIQSLHTNNFFYKITSKGNEIRIKPLDFFILY